MTYTLAQKNRWNRFRRNKPRLARGFILHSDEPISLHEDIWLRISKQAKSSGKRFKRIMACRVRLTYQ